MKRLPAPPLISPRVHLRAVSTVTHFAVRMTYRRASARMNELPMTEDLVSLFGWEADEVVGTLPERARTHLIHHMGHAHVLFRRPEAQLLGPA